MDRGVRTRIWLSILVACYALLVVLIVWSLISARRWALAEMATPNSASQWEVWRDDVRKQQAGSSPVSRRVPKSTEPPTLVLLRDHFAVMLAGAVVFSSVLYWITAWLIIGMLSTPAKHAES